MSTVADLEVRQLEEHVAVGGFLSPFTDIFGNPQPAPIFQAFELDLMPDSDSSTSIKKDDRVIMIRETGNVVSALRTFVKEKPMMVLVVGKVGQTDRTIAKGLANDIENYLVKSFSDGGCISNIVSSGVTGPFIESDRRMFQINITVMFNIIR